MLQRARVSKYDKRDLAASTTDGVAHGAMIGFGETYIAPFALAVGVGETLSGLITTLPMLMGGLFQLAAPWGSRKLLSRKRWVVLTASLQATSFLLLALAALAGSIPTFLLFFIASLYWGSGLATGPAWTTWIETLVPARIRAHYLARRTSFSQIAIVAGIVLGGLSLNHAAKCDWLLPAFAIIFGIAAGSRALSSVALAFQREPTPPKLSERRQPLRETFAGIASMPVGRLILFLLLIQTSVHVSGPFFSAYMLVQVKFTYAEYLCLVAASFGAKVFALSFLGGIARRIGPWQTFCLGTCGMLPLPALWLVSQDFWYLMGVQTLSGTSWATFELGMLLLFFQEIPSDRRTEVLTLFNVAHMACAAIGSLLGVILMSLMPTTYLGYAAVFATSSTGRVAALLMFPHKESFGNIMRNIPRCASMLGHRWTTASISTRRKPLVSPAPIDSAA